MPNPTENAPNPWEVYGAEMGRIETSYKEATDKAKATRKEAIKKAKTDRDAALKAPSAPAEAQAA